MKGNKPENFAEQTLDAKKEGRTFLLGAIFTAAVVYFAAAPETAAVLIIEYLKFPPEFVLQIIPIALAALISMMASRPLTFFVLKSMPLIIVVVLTPVLVVWGLIAILIGAGISIRDRIEKRHHIRTPLEFFKKSLVKFSVRLKPWAKKELALRKKTRFLWENIAIFIVLFLIILVANTRDNAISKKWSIRNQLLVVTANLHYYCQITGTYNQRQCDYWKVQRDKIFPDSTK